MPRTANLNIPAYDPWEQAAIFFTVLAYPSEEQEAERKRFHKALCRWFILRVARNDEFWRWNQKVRPAYFLNDEKYSSKIFDKGFIQIQYRLTAAWFVAMPHFNAIRTGKLDRVEGLKPTVTHMLDLARWNLSEFGWKPDSASGSTARTKLWKPTRPVVHAAAALLFCMKSIFPAGTSFGLESVITVCLLDQEMLGIVIYLSEYYRQLLPEIEQFCISDDEVVQFVGVESQRINDALREHSAMERDPTNGMK